MALCGYIALEEAMGLLYDRLLDEWILSTPHMDIALIHLLLRVSLLPEDGYKNGRNILH